MSTDLYGVRILEVEPEARRIRIRAFVVYYDTHYEHHQPVPSDRSFFVRVLCDRDALGDDIAEDDRFSEPWVDRNAFRYVERFVELERRNFPVKSYEGYSDFYYERGGAWKDEERLVQADYDVYVTKEEYVAGFSAGDSWGTTSYPTCADALTGEDYPHVPDFGDVYRSSAPFADKEGEATVVDAMAFSADGARLALTHNDGGHRVVAVEDGRVLADVEEEGGAWGCYAGWTHDGRVAWWTRDGFVALDLATGQREPFAPFGCQAASTGERFLEEEEESYKILDRSGETLYEGAKPADYRVAVGFDAAGARCAVAVEQTTSLELIDLNAKTARTLEIGARSAALALSPDGRYLLAATYEAGFVVLRADDGAVIRRWKPSSGRIPTAAAWSPDGRWVATSSCDSMGYRSEVAIHRVGREIDAAALRPIAPPPREPRGIADVARLYLERTRGFDAGWAFHLDNDLVDFHLALVRLGHDLDLTPDMRQPHSPLFARACEAVLAAEQGDEARARRALADAEERLGALDVQPWQVTPLYAPLAAAKHLLGDAAGSAEALGRARSGLGDETNPFQARGVLARALLRMGRRRDVSALIGEAAGSFLSSFQVRLLVDLVDKGAFDLLKRACYDWRVGQDWTAREALQRALLENGQHERAASFELLDPDQWLGQAVGAWRRWSEVDPGAAQAHLARSPRLQQAVSSLGPAEPAADPASPEGLSEADRCSWLAARGRWDDAYALLSAVKPTLRQPLYQRIAAAARERGDIDVLLDALRRLPCEDMNSPGLRALQAAFRGLAGLAYREDHI